MNKKKKKASKTGQTPKKPVSVTISVGGKPIFQTEVSKLQ